MSPRYVATSCSMGITKPQLVQCCCHIASACDAVSAQVSAPCRTGTGIFGKHPAAQAQPLPVGSSRSPKMSRFAPHIQHTIHPDTCCPFTTRSHMLHEACISRQSRHSMSVPVVTTHVGKLGVLVAAQKKRAVKYSQNSAPHSSTKGSCP